jgi:hypothetical protein
MNGTNEYSVNEWNEWIERLNIPWMNGTNEWIFREWMEWMNIPCMNGTTEYSLHEWNVWIFHEWIIREWIFLVLGGPCQVQTENVLRLLLWALWISSQFFAGSVSLSLCGLCTQQLEIANSVAAFKLFVMVEKTSRRDLQILIWDISELSSQFGSQGFFLGVGFGDGCLPVHSLTLCLQLHWLCQEAAAPVLCSSCIFLIALSFSTSSSSPNQLLQFVSRCTTAL